jgi:rubrerythrin
MSKTTENLKAAFAGESQANRNYLYYAKIAEKEGNEQIAKLFRAVAAAETVHAHNHKSILGGVENTADCLNAAISGENYEVVTMYPDFMETAEAEGEKKALTSFKWAWEVEKYHEVLYKETLEALASGVSIAEVDYYVCPVCGYTHRGKPTDRCPVCNTLPERFEKVS